jgi:hypothetical protein
MLQEQKRKIRNITPPIRGCERPIYQKDLKYYLSHFALQRKPL